MQDPSRVPAQRARGARVGPASALPMRRAPRYLSTRELSTDPDEALPGVDFVSTLSVTPFTSLACNSIAFSINQRFVRFCWASFSWILGTPKVSNRFHKFVTTCWDIMKPMRVRFNIHLAMRQCSVSAKLRLISAVADYYFTSLAKAMEFCDCGRW